MKTFIWQWTFHLKSWWNGTGSIDLPSWWTVGLLLDVWKETDGGSIHLRCFIVWNVHLCFHARRTLSNDSCQIHVESHDLEVEGFIIVWSCLILVCGLGRDLVRVQCYALVSPVFYVNICQQGRKVDGTQNITAKELEFDYVVCACIVRKQWSLTNLSTDFNSSN